MANLPIAAQRPSASSASSSNGTASSSGSSVRHSEDAKEFQSKLNSAADRSPEEVSKLAESEKKEILEESTQKKAQKRASAQAEKAALEAGAVGSTKSAILPQLPQGAASKDAVSGKVPNKNELVVQNQLKSGASTVNASELAKQAEMTKQAELAKQAEAAKQAGVSGQNHPEVGASAVDGVALASLAGLEAGDLQVDSLKVSGKTSGKNLGAEVVSQNKAPSSKLSTADYLNLRELSQNSTQAGRGVTAVNLNDPISAQATAPVSGALAAQFGIGAHSGNAKKSRTEIMADGVAGMSPAQISNHQSGPKVMDAPVTQGSANNTVLSHDAVQQISHQVNMMSQAKQDGEIKIRLRPDHLGELHMQVKTEGQLVSIQIRAKEGTSKKIIEDSLNALRDGLAKQQLTLANIEVVTGNSNANSADGNQQFDMGAFRQNTDSGAGQQTNQQSNQQWNQEQSSARQDRIFEEQQLRSNLGSRLAQVAQGNSAKNSARLDMIA